MNKPTRAEKREAIALFYQTVGAAAATKNLIPSQKSEDIFNAILADYAPLTPERRAEMELRRVVMSGVLSEVDAEVENDPENEYTARRRRVVQSILAEIDAELGEGQ